MKTVRVDFSQGLRDGLVRANLRRASEPLSVGDEVEAFDLEEDMSFTGRVQRIDDDGRFAYLEMDWQDAGVGRSTFVYELVFKLAHDALKNTTSYHDAAETVLRTGVAHGPSQAFAQWETRRGAIYQDFLAFVEEGAHSHSWSRFSSDSAAEAEVGGEQLEMTLAR